MKRIMDAVEASLEGAAVSGATVSISGPTVGHMLGRMQIAAGEELMEAEVLWERQANLMKNQHPRSIHHRYLANGRGRHSY